MVWGFLAKRWVEKLWGNVESGSSGSQQGRKGCFLETKVYLAYNKRNDIANGSAVKL